MKPSEALEKHRETIREILARYPVSNPRIFGSVARGEDTEESDLDIIVQAGDGLTLFNLIDLEAELQTASNIRVEIRTEGDFSDRVMKRIQRVIRPL